MCWERERDQFVLFSELEKFSNIKNDEAFFFFFFFFKSKRLNEERLATGREKVITKLTWIFLLIKSKVKKVN